MYQFVSQPVFDILPAAMQACVDFAPSVLTELFALIAHEQTAMNRHVYCYRVLLPNASIIQQNCPAASVSAPNNRSNLWSAAS